MSQNTVQQQQVDTDANAANSNSGDGSSTAGSRKIGSGGGIIDLFAMQREMVRKRQNEQSTLSYASSAAAPRPQKKQKTTKKASATRKRRVSSVASFIDGEAEESGDDLDNEGASNDDAENEDGEDQNEYQMDDFVRPDNEVEDDDEDDDDDDDDDDNEGADDSLDEQEGGPPASALHKNRRRRDARRQAASVAAASNVSGQRRKQRASALSSAARLAAERHRLQQALHRASAASGNAGGGDSDDEERDNVAHLERMRNLSLEQARQEFHDMTHGGCNYAPPDLSRVHGPQMVRHMDTHVQKTNAGAMDLVINKLHMPPIGETTTQAECFWILRFLENYFGITEYEDEMEQAPGADFDSSSDESSDSGGGGGGDDDSDGADSVQRREAGYSSRGPGNLSAFKFVYSKRDLASTPTWALVMERFGLNAFAACNSAEGDVFDLNYVETLTVGFHSYLGMLKRSLISNRVPMMPYQENLQHAAAVQAMLDAAHGVDAGSDADADADNDGPSARERRLLRQKRQIPRALNTRLTQLHDRVSNTRIVLRGLNVTVAGPARARGLPLDVLASGLVDSSQSSQIGDSAASKGNQRQETVFLMLQQCYVNNYRRCGDHIYEEIMSGKYHTQAYRQLMSIHDFVWDMPNPVSNHTEWLRRTEDKGAQKWIEEYLLSARHSQKEMLPDLQRCRWQFSFKNGIYTGADNRFWEFGKVYPRDGNCPFYTNAVSARFFPCHFRPGLVKAHLTHDVRVPSIEKIFNSQQWDEDTQLWAYTLLGRLLYPVGYMDNWQVAPFLYGLAGTGKSTLIEAIQEAYDKSAVGTLSNNMEDTFGLMSMYDKDLITAPEVRADFRLSQAQFQTMVSGERMSVARKNKSAVEVEHWTAPIILAGNVYPKWIDSGGSLTRRMVTFQFDVKVPEADSIPNLKEHIRAEMPEFLVKINRCYLAAVRAFGTRNIWKALPRSLLNARNRMQKELDKVKMFLDECGADNSDPERYVTVTQFIECMRAYGRVRNWTTDYNTNDDAVYRDIDNAFKNEDKWKAVDARVLKIDHSGRKEYRIYALTLPEVHSGGGGGGGGGVANAALPGFDANSPILFPHQQQQQQQQHSPLPAGLASVAHLRVSAQR